MGRSDQRVIGVLWGGEISEELGVLWVDGCAEMGGTLWTSGGEMMLLDGVCGEPRGAGGPRGLWVQGGFWECPVVVHWWALGLMRWSEGHQGMCLGLPCGSRRV